MRIFEEGDIIYISFRSRRVSPLFRIKTKFTKIEKYVIWVMAMNICSTCLIRNWFELNMLFVCFFLLSKPMQYYHFTMTSNDFYVLKGWIVITIMQRKLLRIRRDVKCEGHSINVSFAEAKENLCERKIVSFQHIYTWIYMYNNTWTGDYHFSGYARRVTMILLLSFESFQLAVIMNIRCFEYVCVCVCHHRAFIVRKIHTQP